MGSEVGNIMKAQSNARIIWGDVIPLGVTMLPIKRFESVG
jgi:hypothetical protein